MVGPVEQDEVLWCVVFVVAVDMVDAEAVFESFTKPVHRPVGVVFQPYVMVVLHLFSVFSGPTRPSGPYSHLSGPSFLVQFRQNCLGDGFVVVTIRVVRG